MSAASSQTLGPGLDLCRHNCHCRNEMKSQACLPCAKRKVRCDRAKPSCSSCKRRKHDQCIYVDVSSSERIKRLEETVRALGGDPLDDSPPRSRSQSSNANPQKLSERIPSTPIMLQGEGRSIYVESQGWQNWLDTTRLPGENMPDSRTVSQSAHSPGNHLPHAFQGSLGKLQNSSMAMRSNCPVSATDSDCLWRYFRQRVEPTIKINFQWTLQRLQSAMRNSEEWPLLSSSEQALSLSICFFATISMNDQECLSRFGQGRTVIMNKHRILAEESFAQLNIFAVEDLTTIKAFCIYVKASVDILSIQSLWSLMGLVSRSAEQLGIHRDGPLMNLNPSETEERRRLWWQLQHIDLILTIKSGVTPLNFTADWDTKLPLNIEDSDLQVASAAAPQERVGLTSLSYTLFSYWIIYQQRAFRLKRLNQPKIVDRSILGPLTDMMIDELEEGLNKTFLQYCDPIHSLDAVVQVSARGLICILRLRRLHEMRLENGSTDEKINEDYFSTCLQSVRYSIVGHSVPALRPFQWLSESAFSWHAFVGILVDLSHFTDVEKIKTTWELLIELYSVAEFLMDLPEDRRRAHAATSVVSTWEVCRLKPGMETFDKPSFVSNLEQRLLHFDTGVERCEQISKPKADAVPLVLDPEPTSVEIGESFNFNFADIDWSFWDNIG